MSASVTRTVEWTFSRRLRRKKLSWGEGVGVVARRVVGLSRIRRILSLGAVCRLERAWIIVSVACVREGEVSVVRPFVPCKGGGCALLVGGVARGLRTAAAGVLVGAGPRCGSTTDPLIGADCDVLCCSALDPVFRTPVSLPPRSPNNPVRPSTKANLPSLATRARSSPAPRLASVRQYSQSRIHETSSTLVSPPITPLPGVFVCSSSPSLSAELMNLETSQCGVASSTPVSKSSEASGGRWITD